jgi:hypothetical protein
MTQRIFVKANATTMVTVTSFAGPQYSPGSYYQLQCFDLDTAGAYIYAIGAPAAGSYFLKINVTTGVLIAAGTTNLASTISAMGHYAAGINERFYVGVTSGGSVAGKMNPATLDWYYPSAGVGLGHSPYGIAADGTYLYVFFEDQGVDRHLQNDISGVPSTEAGIIRLWTNKQGVLTEAANIDDQGDVTSKGNLISEGGDVTLTPKASSSGAEGTIFYCATDNSVYVGVE